MAAMRCRKRSGGTENENKAAWRRNSGWQHVANSKWQAQIMLAK